MAERYQTRLRFWTELLNLAKQKTKLHANISPGKYSWVGTSAGLPNGINLNYGARLYDAQVELYIDAGRDSGERNKAIFKQLEQHKEEIEQKFGEPLVWEALEGKRACRISKKIKVSGWRDEARWPEAHEQMVDSMIRLEKALRSYLKAIRTSKEL